MVIKIKSILINLKTITVKHLIKTIIKGMLLIPFLLISMSVFAQDTNDYEKAKNEIQELYGTFPSWFDAYPKHALSGAWENFKQLAGESNIPSKYKELLQLSVASQIPCVYCVYYHRMAAKSAGATDEEIKEAVALGAQTRQWSMIAQGAETNLEAYKKEVVSIIKFMSEKSKE